MADRAARCAVCSLVLDTSGHCPDCTLRAPAIDRVIAAFDYAAPGDLLIHQLKTSHRFISAGMLAGLLVDAIHAATPVLAGNTILVPVPASRAAILRRGFNPAAEIARCLASRLQFACRPELLTRVHEGVKQTHLGRHERTRSVQALYRCAAGLDGVHIGVVDDVLTTGSTLHSIAQVFKAEGAASVTGLVLARTPYARQF